MRPLPYRRVMGYPLILTRQIHHVMRFERYFKLRLISLNDIHFRQYRFRWCQAMHTSFVLQHAKF